MTNTTQVKLGFTKRFGRSGGNSKLFISLSIICGFSVLVYLLSRFITPFAEFWTRTFGQGVRFFMAKLTTLFPFSVGEAFVVLLPLLVFSAIWYSVKAAKKDEAYGFTRVLVVLISILMVIVIVFCLGFGPSYFRNTLAQNLNLNDSPVSAEALYDTAVWFADKLESIIPNVAYSDTGESHMPCAVSQLSDDINDAFAKYASKADYIDSFTASIKQIVLSEPMTYTHISGVYTFFTGEANVNINYPDFIIPYTIAHEMSHQRGIAREDEANFTAFLVCAESDNCYIQYSGYVNILRNVMDSLYKADKDLYKDFRNKYYANEILNEMSAYSTFFDKYRESVASKVVSTTNNAYLSSQKVKGGVKNYGLVVNLAVAYVASQK